MNHGSLVRRGTRCPPSDLTHTHDHPDMLWKQGSPLAGGSCKRLTKDLFEASRDAAVQSVRGMGAVVCANTMVLQSLKVVLEAAQVVEAVVHEQRQQRRQKEQQEQE